MATGGSVGSEKTAGYRSRSYTPIHHVARYGDLSEVERLVRSGADTGVQDGLGRTPIMLAVYNNQRSVVEYLVTVMSAGDLDVVDDNGCNVLHYIAWYRRPWPQLVECITDKSPNTLQTVDRWGYRPIYLAREELPANRQVYDTLDQLTQKQAQIQQQQQQQYQTGISDSVENPCDITVTVVGHQGVGKSCLVNQLKQEPFPKHGPGSTNTADFSVNYLGYNPDTGYRQKLDEDGEIQSERKRLKRIIDQYQKEEKVDVAASEFVSQLSSSAKSKQGFIKKLGRLFGKLSLKRRRKEIGKITPSTEQRHVIEEVMRSETDDRTDNRLKGHITIYDFGGEKVFYNTHHCFMSSNMIFILVFDVAMCLDSSTSKGGYEIIEFWLKAFATYAVDKNRSKGTPPVILVGSHLDRLSPLKEKQVELFLSVIDQLRQKPEIYEIIEAHVKDMFPVANLNDCTTNQYTYEQMWNRIIEIAPLQSQWRESVPARWVAMEYVLVRQKHAGKIILTYDELLEINRGLTVPLEERDIMNFIRRLQFAGSFLCFDLHSRNPFIVLQPQWIIDAFKVIITAPKFTANLPVMLRSQWMNYEKSGILPHDVITELWGHSATYPFLDEKDKLFIAMETLGLMTKPISDETEVDYFIVPSILQNADPEMFCPILDDPDTVTTVTLCIKFDNPFIPQAVWDKMIANCIHRFKRLTEFGHDGLKFIQRGLACLSVDRVWNMIINCRDNAMKVTMFKKDGDYTVPPGTGINLLKVLEFLLQRILEVNQQNHLGYHFYLHNDFRFTTKDEIVKVDNPRHEPHLQFPCSNSERWMDKNDLYVWFRNPKQKTTSTRKNFQDIPNELPDRQLTHKEIGRVSRFIGTAYQTFFVELDCPIVVVEQEMEEHRHLTFRSRIAKIFIHLCKIKPEIGFLVIADAMKKHGMQSSDLFSILDSNRSMMFKGSGETLPEGWLQKDLSVNDVPIIAGLVDIKAYFNLFLELGLTPRLVDEFDDQYRNKKTPEKIAALLKAFIKETKPRPTLNTILLAMQECDMDTKSLITALGYKKK